MHNHSVADKNGLSIQDELLCNLRNYEEINYASSFRLYLLLLIITNPVFSYIFRNYYNESIIQKLILSAFYLSILVSTYKFPFVYRNIYRFFFYSSFAAFIQLGYLLFLNNYSPAYFLSLFLMNIWLSLIIRSLSHLIIYQMISYFVLTIPVIFIPDPQINRFSILSINTLIHPLLVYIFYLKLINQKKLENTILQKNQMIDIVEKKTKELKLAQMELVQSEKMASIGLLAAGVAHEINNPIGFVFGNSEKLLEYFSAIKKLISRYEQQIHPESIKFHREEFDVDYIMSDLESLLKDNMEGLNRINNIVSNLKNFAHSSQNDEFVEADIEKNMEGTLAIAKNEIKYSADVEKIFGNVSPVHCNIGEINQVFMNIIINSAQAIRGDKSENKRGKIIITTYEDSDSIYCSIADNGPGVPLEIRHKVFEPFFTTKPVGKGTGLGLSIAWDIVVNRHQGEIKLDSESGKGACFTVKLPKKTGKAA